MPFVKINQKPESREVSRFRLSMDLQILLAVGNTIAIDVLDLPLLFGLVSADLDLLRHCCVSFKVKLDECRSCCFFTPI